MKLLRSLLLLVSVALGTASCIDNNLPYPVVPIQVLSVTGEGFTVGNSDIDLEKRIVTLHLDETTDISRVQINEVKITEGGKSEQPLTGTFDLRSPYYVTLSLYQEYEWQFRAEQTIERTFTVEGQIGAAEIDPVQHTATAYVGADTDLSQIHITALKLGPRDITTMSPEPEALTDFSSVRYVEVHYHDFVERWRLYVLHTDQSVAISTADLWAHTGTLSIAAQAGVEQVALEYRRTGTEEWKQVETVRNDNGTWSATLTPTWIESTNEHGLTVYHVDPSTGLFAGTSYDYRLTLDGASGPEGSFTTAAGDLIPAGNMEDGALSCFTTENRNSLTWASGNNSFAAGLCTQGTYAGMEGSHCAKLTAAAPVGILAAGNLFTGIFYKDGLTTGVVEFGQAYSWTARPATLRVKYYAEKIGPVDVDKHDGAPIGSGDQDRARIFAAIVDWGARHKVTSGTSAPTGTWDPTQQSSTDEGRIIGYGSLFITEASTGGSMIDANIPMYYYDKELKPSGNYTLVISCSTSAYGDFMVGCMTNLLYVDDFRWGY